MGGSASYTGGGGPPMPTNNNTLSHRMGLSGMEGSGMPMDPRVTQIMQRYGVRMPTGGTASKPPAKPPAKPATPAAPPRQFSWQFPQYSQTWAFTPPAPSSFTLPPMFDPKTLNSGTNTGNTDPRSPARQILEGILVPHRMG